MTALLTPPAREAPQPTRTPLAGAAVPRRGAHPADRSSAALAASFARPIVDVLLGRRPAEQIRSRVAPSVRKLLASRAWRASLAGPAPRLRSLHACAVTPDLVEGCAVLGSRTRTRALVLRWERTAHGWLCTFLAPV